MTSATSIGEALTTAHAIIDAGRSEGIGVRLLGGLAVWERCTSDSARRLVSSIPRSGDIDLVVSRRDRHRFDTLMREKFKVVPDPQLATIPGGIHGRFYYLDGRRLCDVSYDQFEYCHSFDLSTRIGTDGVTVPLAELLLTKLQIVDPDEKDAYDAIALILSHSFAEEDAEGINLPILLKLCGSDWPLEHTVRLSTCHVARVLLEEAPLSDAEKEKGANSFMQLLEALERASKPIRWRWRALRGPGLRWYRRPETLADPTTDELRRQL